MTHTTLNLDLGSRSYPIYIGSHILGQNFLDKHIQGSQVAIISNTTVAPLYLQAIKEALPNKKVDTILIEDGEQFKTLDTLNQIFTQLLEKQFDRTATLIALGGGVVGDITGFAAACYQRGIDFIQIPTTLLAQVDSSVGGKTAVNHPLGKNMIGAFYQPRCVIADTQTLSTLPAREISAGLAEVIKYGLIYDAKFFDWLENNINDLLNGDPKALAYAIERSCQTKATIVAKDEREQNIRALLNLGHTFGHAIETHTEYKTWLHGEAIAIGMVMAATVSMHEGNLSQQDVDRITHLLQKANLPTSIPNDMDAVCFLKHMSKDKKVAAGKIRLVLLKSIGQAIVSDSYNHDLLTDYLNNHV